MGIYLNKGAKAGFCSRNRASRGRLGIWAASPGGASRRNQSIRNTVALEPLDLIQICSRVNYGGVPPSFSTMGVGMVSFGVQRPFGRQKVHRVEVFALESIPRSLALGLDVVRN